MVLNTLLLGPTQNSYLKLLIVLKEFMWGPTVLFNYLIKKEWPLNNRLAFGRRETWVLSEWLFLA